MLGYHPQVILSGRRINDGMGEYIAAQTVKQMINSGTPVKGSKVHVLGLTFKEDVPDLRNSKVIDVINELRSFGVNVCVHDPLAEPDEARHEYGVDLLSWEDLPRADAIVMAVAHQEFLNRPVTDYLTRVRENGCFIDVKARFDKDELQAAGLRVWRL
jgi:UDP-N-acetyl-D-galactosamine dehydrogenase